MNKQLAYNSFYDGLLKDFFNNQEGVDIIHEHDVFINKTCAEYLSESSYDDEIIVPINVNKCFKYLSNKTEKIEEYLDYLNSSGLFNYEIIKNSKHKRQLTKRLIKESKNKVPFTMSKKIDANYKVINEIILLQNLNFSKNIFKKIIKSVNAELKLKYSDVLADRKTSTLLYLTNDDRLKTLFSTSNKFAGVVINNMISASPIIHNKNCINNANYMLQNISTQGLEAFNRDCELEFIYLNENVSKNTLQNILTMISKNIYKHLYKHNKDNKDCKILYNFYNNLDKINNYKKSKEEKVLQSKVFDFYNDNIMYVKIDGPNLNMECHDKLLIHLTCLRYMFKYGYSHLSKIILNFKNNCNDISVLENLIISSQFHKDKAWHRFNLLKVRSSDYLGRNKIQFETYYNINNIEKIKDNLLNSNCSLDINDIFSNRKSNVIRFGSLTKKENFKSKINNLLKVNNFNEILKVFREISKVSNVNAYKEENKDDESLIQSFISGNDYIEVDSIKF